MIRELGEPGGFSTLFSTFKWSIKMMSKKRQLSLGRVTLGP